MLSTLNSDVIGIIIDNLEEPLKLLGISGKLDKLIYRHTSKLRLYDKITDKELIKFGNLTYLCLGLNEKITDKSLKELKQLYYLNLGYNQNITDESLKKLKKLYTLHLGKNNIKRTTYVFVIITDVIFDPFTSKRT